MLDPGARLGSLEVLGPLGAGGMGEVYRARDSQLGREVAVKVLPESLRNDPSRLARMEREARLLAALNHPGIAAIYGLQHADGAPCLVLELVEGPTLAEVLRGRELPVDEALELARQIAEALEAAHEKGIVHRDLKPSNVKLTSRGRVKLLDFGLGRMLEPEVPATDLSKQSTVSSASDLGVVMGTAPYMSPEQARGLPVDRRSDIWSLGCVLFEMLSGRQAFPGQTVSAAAVLEREPDWAALPLLTPPVQSLLRRCLQKDRERRLHDVADVRIELEEALAEQPAAAMAGPRSRGRPGRLAAVTVALAMAFAAVVLVGVWLGRSPSAPAASEPQRFDLDLRALRILGPGAGAPALAISPDGRRVAFTGCDPERVPACGLYVRAIDQLEPRRLSGTERGVSPFFSPDGRWVAFESEGKLRTASLEDDTVVTLCDAPSLLGGSWGEDGTILFSMRGEGLFRVSAAGGSPEAVTQPDRRRGERIHRHPQILPGGRAALFTIVTDDFSGRRAGIVDLRTGRYRTLLEQALYPRYVATGHVLFTWARSLMAVPFDIDRLEVTGERTPVLRGVLDAAHTGIAWYEHSRSGALVFVPMDPKPYERTLAWIDRSGESRPVLEERRAYDAPSFSPDGRRLAVVIETSLDATDVFILDLEQASWARLTHGGTGTEAVWAADGRSLFIQSRQPAMRLRRLAADGSGGEDELLRGEAQFMGSAPDGRSLLFCTQRLPAQWDIWRLPLEGDRIPEPFLVGDTFDVDPAFSPDGKWVAYVSGEAGVAQIQVRPYPGPGAKHVVAERACCPVWKNAGLFFGGQRARRRLFRAAVHTAPVFRVASVLPVLDIPDAVATSARPYDVHPDGRVLAVLADPRETTPLRLVYVPNWLDELRAKLGAAGR